MKIYYKAQNRKLLVEAISEFTGAESVYMRTPTYSYQIDYFTVDKDGNLNFDDRADSKEIEELIEFLYSKGFVAEEIPQTEEPCGEQIAHFADENCTQVKSMGMTLAFPLEMVQLANLKNLLEAKGALIQKALGISSTAIEADEGKVYFPWFTEEGEALPQAYIRLIEALCRMSRNQKSIRAKAKMVENEKYAFRCFLLRLGFIGQEYKTDRKLLLKNFTGSSAFKNGVRKAEKDDVSQ